MKRIYALLRLAAAIASLSLGSSIAIAQITPDLASQRLLKAYGLDSKILKSYAQLEDKSPRSDGRFEFILAGSPQVDVLLDRDYWVLAAWKESERKKGISFMLNPKDEQSALNITVDPGRAGASGFDKSREPGFSGYTSRAGILGGNSVVWRRCSDSKHLYSDATVILSLESGAAKSDYTLHVDITANTEVRRRALEDCMATLELGKRGTQNEKKPDKEARH